VMRRIAGAVWWALLPLAALDRWYTVALAWLERRGPLSLTIAADGSVEACIGATRIKWQLAGSSLDPTDAGLADRVWSLDLPPPPAVVIFGAGPETALLIPLLRTTGWMTTVVERRERWTAVAQLADRVLNDTPTAALRQIEGVAFDAAVVMHHNFELDREALVELARQPIAFVGLLGPKRRCDDLFSVMPARLHEALAPRLHSPVGLDIGGQGAEAIALSIAAQLHAWRHAK
ncbi:MAG: XdhC family protein, partial [Dokdonella sp.]